MPKIKKKTRPIIKNKIYFIRKNRNKQKKFYFHNQVELEGDFFNFNFKIK